MKRKVIVIVALIESMAVMVVVTYFMVGRGPGPDAAKSDGETICGKHGIPDAECPFCHPSLIAELGECVGHGVPEALCWKCNAVLVKAYEAEGDWCKGHGVPESRCIICNPGLVSGAHDQAVHPTDATVETVGRELSGIGESSRSQRPPNVSCSKEQLRVRLASAKTAEIVGLQLGRVERHSLSRTIRCNAEVVYNANKFLRLTSRVPGVIQKVAGDVGASVEVGDVLLVLDSVALASAKSEYLQAVAMENLWEKNASRERQLVERGVSTGKELLEAETKLAESRVTLAGVGQRLRNLGLSGSQIEAVMEQEETASLLPISSPQKAVIVGRTVVVGEAVEVGATLMELADLSMMWVHLEVQGTDVAEVRVGLPVVVHIDALPGTTFGGRIVWVSTQLDPRTRTLRARAELQNAQGLLRANMFGRGEIAMHESEAMVVVPRSAVQWEGCCNVVFIPEGDLAFAPRKVRLGCEVGDYFEVLSGVAVGESVVTQGSFLLKTEILKGSIGAGCCEVEHLSK